MTSVNFLPGQNLSRCPRLRASHHAGGWVTSHAREKCNLNPSNRSHGIQCRQDDSFQEWPSEGQWCRDADDAPAERPAHDSPTEADSSSDPAAFRHDAEGLEPKEQGRLPPSGSR